MTREQMLLKLYLLRTDSWPLAHISRY